MHVTHLGMSARSASGRDNSLYCHAHACFGTQARLVHLASAAEDVCVFTIVHFTLLHRSDNLAMLSQMRWFWSHKCMEKLLMLHCIIYPVDCYSKDQDL